MLSTAVCWKALLSSFLLGLTLCFQSLLPLLSSSAESGSVLGVKHAQIPWFKQSTLGLVYNQLDAAAGAGPAKLGKRSTQTTQQRPIFRHSRPCVMPMHNMARITLPCLALAALGTFEGAGCPCVMVSPCALFMFFRNITARVGQLRRRLSETYHMGFFDVLFLAALSDFANIAFFKL